jgi:hypothetical protein
VRFLAVPSLLAAVILIAACSGDDTQTVTVRETVTETAPTATNPGTTARVVLYFLESGKVRPEPSTVTAPHIPTAAVSKLLDGSETFATAIAAGTTVQDLRIERGTASIELDPRPADPEAVAQIVFTLTGFPEVKRVAVNGGAPVARSDFEEQTPAILVESPLPGDPVEPGFEVTGTANTFEATFEYELKDSGGRVLSKDFVTATSGSGTRGTFRFTVPYEVARPEDGSLTVFEISAANGSRTNEVSILLRLE